MSCASGPAGPAGPRDGVSPSWPPGDRAVHKQFVEAEGWDEVESTHHDTYELTLPTGDVLRTRISRPPSKKHTYGKSMWAHILRDQLQVTEAEFWACVHDGQLPDRGADDDAPTDAIPIDVVRLLIDRVGLTVQQIRAMSADEAIARLNRFWTTGQ
jgi:hypothetical protein